MPANSQPNPPPSPSVITRTFLRVETLIDGRVHVQEFELSPAQRSGMANVSQFPKPAAAPSSTGPAAPAKPRLPASKFDPKDPGAYIIDFGKHAGKRVDSIGLHDVADYAEHLRSDAEAKREPLRGRAALGVKAIEAYLATRRHDRGALPKGNQ